MSILGILAILFFLLSIYQSLWVNGHGWSDGSYLMFTAIFLAFMAG